MGYGGNLALDQVLVLLSEVIFTRKKERKTMEALKEIACFRFGFVCLIRGLQAKSYGVCQRGSWIYDNVRQHGHLT